MVFYRHGVGLHEEELQPLSAALKRLDMVSASSVFLFHSICDCDVQVWHIGCNDVRLDPMVPRAQDLRFGF